MMLTLTLGTYAVVQLGAMYALVRCVRRANENDRKARLERR